MQKTTDGVAGKEQKKIWKDLGKFGGRYFCPFSV